MLTLLSFPPGLDEPSLSPFCTKAMLLLEMSGQAWRPQWVVNPAAMPMGKLPVLDHGRGRVPDSNLILAWLLRQGAVLWPEGVAKAQAHAVMRMSENHLYFGVVHDRWMRPECWAVIKPVFFGAVPALVRPVLAGIARRGVARQLGGQGTAAFTDPDRLAYMRADLDALSETLGDRPWMMGEQPSPVDASVLPLLSTLDRLPADTPLRSALRRDARLMRYVARGRETLYAPLTPRLATA